MMIRKKELIAASLVVLIGVAGYLNWSYQDTVSVKDGASYIETGKKLGEAQYVTAPEEVEEETKGADDVLQPSEETEETSENAQVETVNDDGGYFEQARLDKETSRSKALEILNQTASNENFDEDVRKKAGEKVISTAEHTEQEAEIESIAQSKGYSEICVYIDDSSATVTVRKDGFSAEDVTVLCELVTAHSNIAANDIRIVEVK